MWDRGLHRAINSVKTGLKEMRLGADCSACIWQTQGYSDSPRICLQSKASLQPNKKLQQTAFERDRSIGPARLPARELPYEYEYEYRVRSTVRVRRNNISGGRAVGRKAD